MALTTCGECRKPVSTEAAACPNCGAPPGRFVQPKQLPDGGKKAAIGAGVIAALFVGIYAANRSTDSAAPPAPSPAPMAAAPAQAPAPPAPPLPPPHMYSVMQDGEYGYEQALSEEDTKAGRAVKPLLMIRYLGRRGDSERWSIVDGNGTALFSCKDPCRAVRQQNYVGNVQIGSQMLPISPGSILSAVVDDIQNSQLVPYDQARKAGTAGQQS